MKILLLIVLLIGLSACEQAPLIALDDPIRAEADARYEGTVFGASGIAGIAYAGASNRDDSATVTYDERFTNAAELAAAPANVCAYLNGTVDTVRNERDQSGFLADNFRVLYIACNV